MNQHFDEMLAALSAAGARFLVVGAHALAAYGIVRATGDIDIWVDAQPTNAERVWQALSEFGAPLQHLQPDDLTQPDLVFQIGLPPMRIDLMTGISGVTFAEAWAERTTIEIDGRPIPVIGRAHLIRNKRATARPQDLADVARLEGQDATS